MKNCIEQVRFLYSKAMEDINRSRIGKEKILIAGASFYAVMKKEKKAITLKEIAEVLHISVYKLGRIYKKLTTILYMIFPESITSSNYIDRVCGNLDLPEKTKQNLSTYSQLLINSYINHNSTKGGTNRLEIITAAGIGLVWNIIDGNEKSHTIHLKSISSILHLPSSTLQKAYVMMKQYYIELLRHLPWGKDIETKTFFVYAKEILIWLPVLTENLIKSRTTTLLENSEDDEKGKKMTMALEHLRNLKEDIPMGKNVLLDQHVLIYERFLLMGISQKGLLSLSLKDLQIMDDHYNTLFSFNDSDIDIYLRSPQEIQLLQTELEKT
jgi:hypothetical protein